MNQRIRSFCVVELEIESGSVWSGDTTMAQIIKQSRDDVEGRLRKLFSDAGADDAKLACKREGSQGIRLKAISKVVTRCEEEW
jgi:hypothetical protein